MVTKSHHENPDRNPGVINKGKLAILEYLFDNLFEKQYFRKICKETGLNPSIVARHLDALTREGILQKEEKDSNSYYSYSRSDPVVYSIMSFLCYRKLGRLESHRRRAVTQFAGDLRGSSLFILLFGSTAGNRQHEGSDLDILVCTRRREDVNVMDTSRYEAVHGVRINPVVVPLEEFRKGGDKIKHIMMTSYCVSGFDTYYGEVYGSN
ncbi:MAG: nucleotidyltransferase domain-containing protein [Candidatus Aenigmatarchaeota archaeon]